MPTQSLPAGEPAKSPAAGSNQATPPQLDKIAGLQPGAAPQVPTQQRIIVRTVDTTLVVDSVPAATERIGGLAVEMGGWVVSTNRTEEHRGTIAVRVPADRVDEALRTLRALAREVRAETSTGVDVTDEYVDLQSRVRNGQKTADQLLKLMERPGEVKDVLEVQRELNRVQEEIERLQGRIRFLEETGAFSLINVKLELAPVEMPVDIGTDQVISGRETATFRAVFTPPEGITDFAFQWDFGDGTPVIPGSRTAPTVEGKRTTATVTHSYGSLDDSPFIVTFTMTGTGEAGIAKGTDTTTITVTKVPNVQVEAGRDLSTREDRPVNFSGSFTRPEGVTDLTYRWEFGDGQLPVEGPIEEGTTALTAEHIYALPSSAAYTATLTVRGKTSHGAVVEGTDTLRVVVIAETPWIARVGDMNETTRQAVRALSATVQGLLIVGIWLAVFSPIWAVGLATIAFVAVRRRRNGNHRTPTTRE